jgi:hypothetical protein
VNSIAETKRQFLTRRTIVRNGLAIAAMSLAAVTGNDVASATTSRRSTGTGDRRDGHSRRRDRHERHPRHARIAAAYDAATGSVIVGGSNLSENARVDIRVDYDWPFLDYSVPWPIPTASAFDYTNNHGIFHRSVHISPGSFPFSGRVEVTDSLTGSRATRSFSVS